MKRNPFYLALLLALALLAACDKRTLTPDDFDTEANELVNKWSLATMKDVYLWNSTISAAMPNSYKEDPRYFFSQMLYYASPREYDRWSLIVADAEQLAKELDGKATATGAHLGFYTFSGTTQVFGLVYYVDKDSPAYAKGMKRGDVILAVNGSVPTTANFQSLFFGTGPFKYKMAKLQGSQVVETGIELDVAPIEFQENPLYLSKVFEQGGKKIGYLVYTSFLDEFNDELSALMTQYKEAGVQELILDLRYNGGGSGAAALHLASLLAPTDAKGKILYQRQWNTNMQREVDSLIQVNPQQYAYLRSEKILDLPQSLGLTKLYVISTAWTASASELVVTGLDPYMDITLIGSDTHGKFTGSSMFTDQTGGHKWAIMPILFKYANSLGYTDFWDGLSANITANDDYSKELGDPNESLLRIALATAAGGPAKKGADQPTVLENPIGIQNIILHRDILWDSSLPQDLMHR